jgi:hypothetical protein
VQGIANLVSSKSPSFRDCYTEEVANAFFFGGCTNVVVDGLCYAGEPWLVSNPSFVPQGLAQGVMDRAAQEGIGDAQSDLPAARNVIHNAPPTLPDSRPSGSIHFMRPVSAGEPVGYVKMGASPYSEWIPFCWAEAL